ncbi:polymerase delta-interacting protein 3-like [Chelonus insularis]|uniref:polymerase delta-interacting protein 3-like n=1 Tax=Chelonus insularis TaxID=460826 RepID=UPI00158E45B9|nr:polymerase delta-interacting protein 3-like [Chelonus insularis]
MADVALDDIIKKKSKPSGKPTMKGRGGIRKGPGRGGRLQPNMPPKNNRKNQIITDARLKIIQKNRAKLTDARDKLAEIAKQSDARLKLEKLRATSLKKINPPFSGITRKTGRSGRLTLSTNKIAPLMSTHLPVSNYTVPNTRVSKYQTSFSEPHGYTMDDVVMDYSNDAFMMDVPLRRTVNNEYALTPPPPPPVFGIKNSSSYDWVNQTSSNSSRNSRKIDHDRPRQLKIIDRAPLSQKTDSTYRDSWSFGSNSRTIITNDDHDEKYYNSRSSRDVSVKSRLDSSLSKSQRSADPVMSRPKTTSLSSSSQQSGYRIVVSNLQANVTQEDIKELFEDVGELIVSRLVRPGTAEVIYKTMKDAAKAVETYHNRQLDGHPMKCLLVNPRPKNNPTAPAVRSISESSRRGTNSSYVQPSLGAVHRALFDDCHN